MSKFTSVVFLIIFTLMFTQNASASVVKITNNGNMIVNVLGVTKDSVVDIPKNDDLKVINVAGSSSDPKSSILIAKADFGTSLSVSKNGKSESFSIEGDKDLVEVEERSEMQRVLISSSGRNFLIRQKGFTAQTGFEIAVDPLNANLSLKTPSGMKYLSILPREALDTLIRAKIITKFDATENATLTETQSADLVYEINGYKSLNLFNLYAYDVSVKSKVSAATGEVIYVDQPIWLNVVSALLG